MHGKMHDALVEFCRDDRNKKFYAEHGLLDDKGLLNLAFFRENIRKPASDWAPGIDIVVLSSQDMASACEFIGDFDKAKTYYWLGSHAWKINEKYYEDGKINKLFLSDETISIKIMKSDVLVSQLLLSAVCNDKLGNYSLARQLYSWVAELRNRTNDEYEVFASTKYGKICSEVWGRKIERTYALVCLERWKEALEEVKAAQKWIDNDPHPRGDHAWRDHFWLLQSLRPLIEYKLEPTEKNKEAARKGLRPSILKSEDHSRTLFLLFYLFNLRVKHPELE